jgi:hypothetical protein
MIRHFFWSGEKNTMRKLVTALLATGALLIFGCGTTQTYDGPKKAVQEVAVLKTNVGEIALDTAWVGRLDGKEIVLAYSELEVLPGLRSIQVNVKRGFLTRSKAFSFEARAGRSYRVRGEFGSGYAWIEDESTGEIVAGEKP